MNMKQKAESAMKVYALATTNELLGPDISIHFSESEAIQALFEWYEKFGIDMSKYPEGKIPELTQEDDALVDCDIWNIEEAVVPPTEIYALVKGGILQDVYSNQDAWIDVYDADEQDISEDERKVMDDKWEDVANSMKKAGWADLFNRY